MRYVFFSILILIGSVTYGQTQVPNRGFEDWPDEATSSPKGWHSYDESTGAFSKAMSNKGSVGNPAALERVAGHNGKYAVAIRCTKILGVSANGALTLGRVCMNAMGASSPKNYCYTDRKAGYAFRFTGRPDSVYFWAKFNMKGDVHATAKAHLHTDCDFKDFVDIGQSSDIASAIFYIKNPKDNKWHQYKRAFKAYDKVYKATADQAPIPTLSNWTRKPNYMLFSFSTNRYVMKGDKGDELCLDDIRLVYNKALSSIMIDGSDMEDFDKNKTDYTWIVSPDLIGYGLPVVSAKTESPRASIEVRQATLDNPTATITVSHDDVESGEAEPRIYTVRFILEDKPLLSKE